MASRIVNGWPSGAVLEDEVVVLSARILPSFKLRRTTRKYIFKQVMEGVLPKSVIWRPKAGFIAPARAWLVGSLRLAVAELLSPASVRARGLFEPQARYDVGGASCAGVGRGRLRTSREPPR
jgi:asparagine synthase (glutamine-hydrolysing)